jgi:hypothetical protein
MIPADFFLFLWGITSLLLTYFVYKTLLKNLLIKLGVSNNKVQIAISFFLSVIIAFVVVSFVLKLSK